MKQMETRVNCANTGRRDRMNGGRREKGRNVDWWRTSEMAEAEIGRKRDWGTMAEKERQTDREKERERERKTVCAREREIESSCNSISLALPLGRHSPLPEGPTYPSRRRIQLPRVLRVRNLSEVSESYPQPGRSLSRISVEYYPRRRRASSFLFLPRKAR